MPSRTPAGILQSTDPRSTKHGSTALLHHIEIYVSNLPASHAFWLPLLARIGYRERNAWDSGFSLTLTDSGPYLTFVQVEDAHADRTFHRCGPGLNHLAFSVPTREAVDGLRHHCIEHGHTLLYDERYPFATADDYYALFVEDPDRLKVEFVAD